MEDVACHDELAVYDVPKFITGIALMCFIKVFHLALRI